MQHLQHLAPNVVHDVWPWAALLLLGAAHGINPGMGWLFAVGLGMQRQERGAVWRALLPLAAGLTTRIRNGMTMSPAPCAEAMRNDHTATSRLPTDIPPYRG